MWNMRPVKPLQDPYTDGPMDILSDNFKKGSDLEAVQHTGHAIAVGAHIVWMIGKNVALAMLGQ